MATLTAKENFLRLLRGEIPESVPLWTMGMPGFNGEREFTMVGPFIFMPPMGGPNTKPGEKTVDIWGVTRVGNAETNFGYLPEPGNFILKDITKWHEVIKKPPMPVIDWEKKAKEDYLESKIDTSKSASMAMFGFDPFQSLMAFMGFSEGLCAMHEEPESVKELLNFICDFYEPIIEKTVEYYKPDCMYMLDDSATKINPFVSVEMYKDILKPIYMRMAKHAMNRGIPIEFHNCGRCEDYIPDMIDFGVKIWDPAQVDNDLVAVKTKYGKQIAIAGGYEYKLPSTWPNFDEEEVRQSVRDTIDKLAPGGGFTFGGAVIGPAGDEAGPKITRIIHEEAWNYGLDYYSKH